MAEGAKGARDTEYLDVKKGISFELLKWEARQKVEVEKKERNTGKPKKGHMCPVRPGQSLRHLRRLKVCLMKSCPGRTH